MNMRLMLGMVGLVVAALLVSGCSSISAEDQAYLTAQQNSAAELTLMMQDFSTATNAKEWAAIITTGKQTSARAQFWHDKITALPVTSKYINSKNAYVQGLLELADGGDGWAKAAHLLTTGYGLQGLSQAEDANKHLIQWSEFWKISTETLPK